MKTEMLKLEFEGPEELIGRVAMIQFLAVPGSYAVMTTAQPVNKPEVDEQIPGQITIEELIKEGL